MSEWIDLNERLPESPCDVWVLKRPFKKKEARAMQGSYWMLAGKPVFSVPGNTYSAPHWERVGLTHWKLRGASLPPPAPPAPRGIVTSPESPKRRYNMTPEGRAAKRAAMREYWRKKKEQQS